MKNNTYENWDGWGARENVMEEGEVKQDPDVYIELGKRRKERGGWVWIPAGRKLSSGLVCKFITTQIEAELKMSVHTAQWITEDAHQCLPVKSLKH